MRIRRLWTAAILGLAAWPALAADDIPVPRPGEAVKMEMPKGDPDKTSVTLRLTATEDDPVTFETSTFYFDTLLKVYDADAVVADWKPYFVGAATPFSWAPAEAEVLPDRSLGFTSGSVYDATGQRIGSFHSVSRRERNGSRKIVFDKGCPRCDCDAPDPGVAPALSSSHHGTGR